MKSLIGLTRSLFIDLKRLHPEVRGLERDLLTLEARVEDEGIGFLTVALPAFGKAFDRGLSSGRLPSILGFCKAKGESIPSFLSGMTGRVFDSKTGLILDEAPTDLILSIRQVLYLFKKLVTDSAREEVLHERAADNFVETDLRIGQLPADLVPKVARAARMILQGLDSWQELACRHGPGAVCEGLTSNQKWVAVQTGLVDFDPRLMYAGYDLPAMLASETVPPVNEVSANDSSSISARFVTVAKSSTARRAITVEPIINQFVQQGLNLQLRETILRCPVMRRSLALSDQGPNQLLALDGSLTGKWCTIDLSSASDLLSLDLVQLVFASYPRFLLGIDLCRTPRVRVGSSDIVLRKFAGMGNAMTFPVQSVVFALLANLASHGDGESITIESLKRHASDVRVYGDDIICRTEHFSRVAEWLTRFGLQINQAKTFHEGNFRESCGVDAWRGTCVTPVYLHHQPSNLKESSAVASNVSTSNQLWLRGYYVAAKFVEGYVDGKYHLPLVPNDSSALGWHTRQNLTSYQRWSRSLHRYEFKSYVVSALKRPDTIDGVAALVKFYHLPKLGEIDKNHAKESSRRYTTCLRKRWVQSR